MTRKEILIEIMRFDEELGLYQDSKDKANYGDMKTAEDFLKSKMYFEDDSVPFNVAADILREYVRINLIEYMRALRESEEVTREIKWARKKK